MKTWLRFLFVAGRSKYHEAEKALSGSVPVDFIRNHFIVDDEVLWSERPYVTGSVTTARKEIFLNRFLSTNYSKYLPMKKLYLFIVIAALMSSASAQQEGGASPQQNNPYAAPQQQRRSTGFQPHARINLYGTYVFDDSFDYYYSSYDYYYGTLEGGFRGGAGLEYMMRPNAGIEVQWLHQDTNAPTYFQRDVGYAVDYDNFVVGLDYIMLAFNKYAASSSGKVEGYASLLAGMAIVGIDSPSRNASGSVSKFAWGMRLGANIWATPRIGLKLQADLMSIVNGVGGGLYFGTGGVGAGVTTYSTFYQFGLGGGLAFKLGQ